MHLVHIGVVMEDFILNGFTFGSNEDWVQLTCLFLAVLRVYLELIGIDFVKLPATQRIFRKDYERAQRFHKSGLYLSLGYILLYSPVVLFS